MHGLLFFSLLLPLLWPLWIAKLSPSLLAPCNVILAWETLKLVGYTVSMLYFMPLPPFQLPASQTREAANTLLQLGYFSGLS